MIAAIGLDVNVEKLQANPEWARLAQEAPLVDLEIRPPPTTTAGARDALERGDVDLALGLQVEDAALEGHVDLRGLGHGPAFHSTAAPTSASSPPPA